MKRWGRLHGSSHRQPMLKICRSRSKRRSSFQQTRSKVSLKLLTQRWQFNVKTGWRLSASYYILYLYQDLSTVPPLGDNLAFYQMSCIPLNHRNVPLFCANAEKNCIAFAGRSRFFAHYVPVKEFPRLAGLSIRLALKMWFSVFKRKCVKPIKCKYGPP